MSNPSQENRLLVLSTVLGADTLLIRSIDGVEGISQLYSYRVEATAFNDVTIDFGALIGGAALLTEVVFGLQGVGKLTYDSLQNFDLPVILACVLYAAFFVVIANFVVDLMYAWLDPRIGVR